AGRAAFLLVGAMIATAMSANVLAWIIPGQRKVVAAIKAGRPVDAVHGQRGKQRSVHNTYFTLPVLIAMLSNHYGMLYSHPHNWPLLLLVLALLAALIVWLAPAPRPAAAAAPSLAQVQAVVEQRCVICHNAQLAQKGVQLNTAALIEQH